MIYDRYFEVWGNTLKRSNTKAEHVVIPDVVKRIGSNVFTHRDCIRSITLPEGVTTIDPEAFANCGNLEEINLPKGLTFIGADAFRDCSSLKSIHIPAGVTVVGNRAFLRCRSLTDVTFAEGVTVIGDSAFYGCASIISLTIPSSISRIEECAFFQCRSLKGLFIYDGIEELGRYAFYKCSALTAVRLPETLKTIGIGTFSRCTSLTDINIPKGLAHIDKYAFFHCDALDIFIPGSPTVGTEALTCVKSILAPNMPISNYATPENKLEALMGYWNNIDLFTDRKVADTYKRYAMLRRKQILPEIFEHDLVERLIFYAENKKITAVNYEEEYLNPAMEQNATDCITFLIDWQGRNISPQETERAFERELMKDPLNAADMKKLWSYEILPDGTLSLVSYKGDETDVYVPERIGKRTVTQLGDNVFSDTNINGAYKSDSRRNSLGCIRTVTLPDTITHIGKKAFYRRNMLTSVSIPDSVVSIGEDAFKGCRSLSDENGFIIVKNILFERLRYEGDIVIPDGVKAIDCDVFNNGAIYTVKLPEGLERIGRDAFAECGVLDSINIPDSVRYIGEGAFRKCFSLPEFNMPKDIEFIGDRAFHGCTALKDENDFIIFKNILFGYCGREEYVTVPDGVTEIGSRAFYNSTHIKEITLPESLRKIGSEAFYNCTHIKEITLPESLRKIGSEAFAGCMSLRKINLHEGIEAFGAMAFKGCRELSDVCGFVSANNVLYDYFGSEDSIIIPRGITEIEEKALSYNSDITAAVIARTVRHIGSSAFYRCRKLATVVLLDGIESIGSKAFSNCQRLTRVSIPASVQEIASDVFAASPKVKIGGIKGSFAESYAKKYNIPFEVEEGPARRL